MFGKVNVALARRRLVLIAAPVLALSGVVPVLAGGETLAQPVDSGTAIYPALYRIAPTLADPAMGPQWASVRAGVGGIWMNAVGATADEVADTIKMLDGAEYPVILPGGCNAGAGGVVCASSSSLERVSAANARLTGSGKGLVAVDRAFNLADVIGTVPIADIVAGINASEADPAYAGIRSGILVHPRDGLDGSFDVTKQAIDAIDAGGVVAIEVSPDLLDSRNVLTGAANVFTYAQSQGKQAVWLMNGPRGTIDEWIASTKLAIDSWQADFGLELDVIAPIATLIPDSMPILPEGDGSWPPQPTYLAVINSLLGLTGGAGPTPPSTPSMPPPSTGGLVPVTQANLRPAVRLGVLSAT
jgi:hypothetical protein